MNRFLRFLPQSWRSLFFPGVASEGGILAYHSIDRNSIATTVTPQEFERHMQYLKQKKYNIISLSDMCLRLSEGLSVANCVAITFDGGYSDFFTNAFPVLKRNNFPATVFLISGKLGEEFNPTSSKTALKIMSAGDVKRASTANDLIEFMPLTETYRVLPSLALADAAKEINTSRTHIEELTGKPADILAYPKGKYSDEIIDYLKKSGAWLAAVTHDAGTVQKSENAFRIKRIVIDSKTNTPVFKKKLAGKF